MLCVVGAREGCCRRLLRVANRVQAQSQSVPCHISAVAVATGITRSFQSGMSFVVFCLSASADARVRYGAGLPGW
jgi:hypothetical protein